MAEQGTSDFPEKALILYIDDEEHNLTAFKAAFRRDFRVHTATSAQAAFETIKELDEPFEVIVSDQRMPGMMGIEFFAEVKDKEPAGIRILLTGYADINAVIEGVNKGETYRYLNKPWHEEELKITLNNAIETFRLRESNKRLTEKLAKTNEQLEFLLRQELIS